MFCWRAKRRKDAAAAADDDEPAASIRLVAHHQVLLVSNVEITKFAILVSIRLNALKALRSRPMIFGATP